MRPREAQQRACSLKQQQPFIELLTSNTIRCEDALHTKLPNLLSDYATTWLKHINKKTCSMFQGSSSKNSMSANATPLALEISAK